MPFLGYCLLMLVPYSAVKLESQEECWVFIAKIPPIMEHRERRAAFGAGEKHGRWQALLACNSRPNLFGIKSWFSPTTYSLPLPHTYKCCFQGHCKCYCRSIWIWKIHLKWDINSSCPFLWNSCRKTRAMFYASRVWKNFRWLIGILRLNKMGFTQADSNLYQFSSAITILHNKQS